MRDTYILLPSKPKAVSEEAFSGVYEIDGLYPGYGHTLGNSLRRIILSSLPGAAVTSVKIDGASHEFSTLENIREDVITILLNLKKIRFKMHTDEPQELTLTGKGAKVLTAGDIKAPTQVEILNPEHSIVEITGSSEFSMTMKVEKGLGFVLREELQKEKVEVGTILLDAIFTPIRRVNYEVESMRVGERTDHDRLRIKIETDGSISSRDALENSIRVMIKQLEAIVGFEKIVSNEISIEESDKPSFNEPKKEKKVPIEKEDIDPDILKIRIETLPLGTRTINSLANANIRTVGGLVRKKESDLLELEGLGDKGIQEIKKALTEIELSLKD